MSVKKLHISLGGKALVDVTIDEDQVDIMPRGGMSLIALWRQLVAGKPPLTIKAEDVVDETSPPSPPVRST